MELKDIELMQAGVRANGIVFTAQELEDIANAHKALGLDGKVPLKLGHNDQQPILDGKPALGWARNLRVVGDKLVADFTDLPKVIYDAFKTGRYKNVSVELLRFVQVSTRVIPWVLDAVALLGADQPAFGTLKDLQSLTMVRGVPLAHESRATFSMNAGTDFERQNEALKAELREVRFRSATDAAIQAGRVTPADVQRFSAVVPPEGRTVEAWQRYSAGLAPPNYHRGNRTYAGEGLESDRRGDGSAGEQLNRLTDAYIEEQRAKFGRTVDYFAAAKIVQRKNPEVTGAWHEEQQGR